MIDEPIDNGTISPVIRSKNSRRDASSKPRTVARPKEQDTRSNPEHKMEAMEAISWASIACSIMMLHILMDWWQQEGIAMMKHAHREINLANEMSILLEMIDKDGAVSSALQHS